MNYMHEEVCISIGDGWRGGGDSLRVAYPNTRVAIHPSSPTILHLSTQLSEECFNFILWLFIISLFTYGVLMI